MRERGQAIVLIGFMGSGKSSVGRCLAEKTDLPRYDTDEMVSARAVISVAEIFAQRGEEEFRALETDVLRQLPEGPAIIVTGGGIVLRPPNMQILRRLGTVVNLMADEATLFERVSLSGTRPLLKTENPRATLAELLHIREPLYRAAADFVVDTSRLRYEEVADLILHLRTETDDG